MTKPVKSPKVSGMRLPFIIFAAIMLYGIPSWAQTMTQVRPLSFGTFAILNNSGAKTITVAPDNSTVYHPDIVADIPAQSGHYTLEEMPANVTFYLGISVSNPPGDGGLVLDNATSLTGGAQPFTLTDFTVNANNTVVTDGDGDADMYIGATLVTSGNGAAYTDGVYTGTYDITFFY